MIASLTITATRPCLHPGCAAVLAVESGDRRYYCAEHAPTQQVRDLIHAHALCELSELLHFRGRRPRGIA